MGESEKWLHLCTPRLSIQIHCDAHKKTAGLMVCVVKVVVLIYLLSLFFDFGSDDSSMLVKDTPFQHNI